jgi:ATP-dependent DNA helicase RecG
VHRRKQSRFPSFETDEDRTFLLVRLPIHARFTQEAAARKSRATGQVTGQVAVDVLQFCQQSRKPSEIQSLIGVRYRETFQDDDLRPLIAKGWIELTIPEKPNSRLQRYQTTPEGKNSLQTAAASLSSGRW